MEKLVNGECIVHIILNSLMCCIFITYTNKKGSFSTFPI